MTVWNTFSAQPEAINFDAPRYFFPSWPAMHLISESYLPESRIPGACEDNDWQDWKKYGQSHPINSVHPRMYYKCSRPNCAAKKMEERMENGLIKKTFKEKHNHNLGLVFQESTQEVQNDVICSSPQDQYHGSGLQVIPTLLHTTSGQSNMTSDGSFMEERSEENLDALKSDVLGEELSLQSEEPPHSFTEYFSRELLDETDNHLSPSILQHANFWDSDGWVKQLKGELEGPNLTSGIGVFPRVHSLSCIFNLQDVPRASHRIAPGQDQCKIPEYHRSLLSAVQYTHLTSTENSGVWSSFSSNSSHNTLWNLSSTATSEPMQQLPTQNVDYGSSSVIFSRSNLKGVEKAQGSSVKSDVRFPENEVKKKRKQIVATGSAIVSPENLRKVLEDDGFKWRKYGNKKIKKIIEGNVECFRRTYFRCASKDCSAKVWTEASLNIQATSEIMVTYLDDHCHDPAIRVVHVIEERGSWER